MARGLLENDHEWRICLKEAIAIQPGMVCHRLLAVIVRAQFTHKAKTLRANE